MYLNARITRCGTIIVKQCFGPYTNNAGVAVDVTVGGVYVGGTPTGSEPSEEVAVDFTFTDGQELAISEEAVGVAQIFSLYLGPCLPACPAWESVAPPVDNVTSGNWATLPFMSVALSGDGTDLAVGEPAHDGDDASPTDGNDGRVRTYRLIGGACDSRVAR